MPTRRLLLIAATLSAFLYSSPGRADENASANRIFVDAVKSWNEAASLTGDGLPTLERRAALLEHVTQRLAQIVQDHPGANLAVKLVSGEQVGSLSLASAEEALKDTRAASARVQCNAKPTRACVFEEALATARSI